MLDRRWSLRQAEGHGFLPEEMKTGWAWGLPLGAQTWTSHL